MFYIFSGKPGAGKSYRLICDIYSDLNKKYVIFHNLDGVKPELFPFPDRLKSIPDLYPSEFADYSFFTEDFQKKLVHAVAGDERYQVKDKKGNFQPLPVCVIVDEAHRIFDEKNKACLAWLSYHRHLGQLVIFCTQKETMLYHSYRALMAFEIRAKADIGFAFLYQKIENGENTGFSFRIKRQSIFKKYLSYELIPPKHRNLIYLFILIFSLVCSVYFFNNPFGDSEEAENEKEAISDDIKQTAVASAPVQSPVMPVGSGLQKSTLSQYLNPEFFFSGSFLEYKGNKIDSVKSRFLIIDASGSCFDFRELFPNLVYLSHTYYVLTAFDSVNKTLHIFRSPPANLFNDNDQDGSGLRGGSRASTADQNHPDFLTARSGVDNTENRQVFNVGSSSDIE